MTTDDDRTLMWALRFEPCDKTDTCPSTYHHSDCPKADHG